MFNDSLLYLASELCALLHRISLYIYRFHCNSFISKFHCCNGLRLTCSHGREEESVQNVVQILDSSNATWLQEGYVCRRQIPVLADPPVAGGSRHKTAQCKGQPWWVQELRSSAKLFQLNEPRNISIHVYSSTQL